MDRTQQPLCTLLRPRLLIEAARSGLRDYDRNQQLKKLLKARALPRPGDAMGALREIEQEHNLRRKAKDPTYSAARHLEALIALIAELDATSTAQAA